MDHYRIAGWIVISRKEARNAVASADQPKEKKYTDITSSTEPT